jgi:hypothetical protein
MADPATAEQAPPSKGSRLESHMTRRPGAKSITLFLVAVAGGLCFIAFHVAWDMKTVTVTSI